MPVPKQPNNGQPSSVFAQKMAGAPRPGQRRSEPLWKGPEEDGITFSMLSRFVVCRERFRVNFIEGLQPPDSFNHRIEYGSMWHACEEGHLRGGDDSWMASLQLYTQELARKYPSAQDHIVKWYRICLLQFPIYLEYWERNPDKLTADRQPLISEFAFRVPYHLPCGRTVYLRGKMDDVSLAGEGKQRGLWLGENKTKGDIDELQIKRQLHFDLQTMMYMTVLAEMHDESGMPEEFDHPIRGVRYNVIRRPLSGGKGSIKQKQGETEDQYYDRLAEYIINEPGTYFMRWNVEIDKYAIERFRIRCLTPLLQQVVDWYDWIMECEGDYFKDSYACGVHWQHPFGVYNVLDEGGSTDLDEYLATGSEVGLTRTDRLFTELE